MLCSLFKDYTQCPSYSLIPSLLYLLSIVSPFFFPVPSHSFDPLEDLWPSLSQHGFVSVLPDDEDLEFWRSYLRIHFHHWWIPLLQLSIIIYWLTDCWILSMFDFSLPLFTWLGLYLVLGSCMKTLVPHLWTKLHKTMFRFYIQLLDLWRLIIIILWLRSTFVLYVVFTRIIWCNQIL